MLRNRCLAAMNANKRPAQRRVRARRMNSYPEARQTPFPDHYWEHLLAGSAVCLFTVLGYWHHPAWLAGSFLVSIYLMVFAVLGECPLITLLAYALGIAPRSVPQAQHNHSPDPDSEYSESDWWTIY